jgi:hypothetical protein
MRADRPRPISACRSLLLSSILTLLFLMCSRGLGQDRAKATAPAPPRQLGLELVSLAAQAVGEGFARAVGLVAYPKPELDFLEQILYPAYGPNNNIGDAMSNLGRWLLRNDEITRGRRVNVPSCVFVFTGTSDKAHPEGVAWACADVVPGRSPSYSTWIRVLPAKVGISAKIVAMVDVVGTDKAEKKVGYVSEATFQLKDGNWKLADLRTTTRVDPEERR